MVIEENKDMEHLTETVIKFIDEQYPVKDFTFKVHARRGDKQFRLTPWQSTWKSEDSY